MCYQKNIFKFTSIDYPYNVLDAIIINKDFHSINKYASFIREKKISKAHIISDSLDILTLCPFLNQLKIHPHFSSGTTFDFTPLYEHTCVKQLDCVNTIDPGIVYPIDFSLVSGLEELGFGFNKGCVNYNKISTLKSLSVGGYFSPTHDLSNLFCSENLDTLELRQCRERSLNGIEISRNLSCLYIYHNRALEDISALKSCTKTLTALRIQNCPKIEDFSILEELENLELLQLSGSNKLPDLRFLEKMKNLKTFTFSMNVEDGDLSPCLRLSYVYSQKNHKHYNLKDKDMPKNEYIRGNDGIEEWRRME